MSESTPRARRVRASSRRAGAALVALFVLLLPALTTGCGGTALCVPPAAGVLRAIGPNATDEAFLDDVAHRTFLYFWELADPHTGLIPDRWPTRSFASVAATGFGLTAYPIGAERGWITREAASERTLKTLRFLAAAPVGDAPAGMTAYHGFYYHFLDLSTGRRFETVELSTVDTALLLAGVMFAGEYFDGSDPQEQEIRQLAERLYDGADWTWAQPRPPSIVLGWHPESGFIHSDWRGYNEAMLVYLMALGSTTHPVGDDAWGEWTSRYKVADFEGQRYLQFAPLFGHHYSHVWIDFRGIADPAIRNAGLDYFENSRRATLAQRAWAIRNPRSWKGLGADVWGVSACDGPADVELPYGNETRRFWTYAGRGVGADFVLDDGTIAPTAAGGSVPFAPEVAIPALRAMSERYGAPLYGRYGFVDAFNPSWDYSAKLHHGHRVPGVGWFDTDWLGIDQGPLLAMIENYRSGLIWKTMRKNPHLRRGLTRAGFAGGWLDGAP
ncbi:MAG: glucoamylase family protein [Acidobacteriota bacterium]